MQCLRSPQGIMRSAGERARGESEVFLNSPHAETGMHRTRERFKTYKGVFDEFTLRNIFKLASEGHFEGLVSPISVGKESNVFSARTKEGAFVAVKIYRLENCDFNRMYDYIKGDPRFTGLLKQRRKVIFAWAQREYRNLLIAHEAAVAAPLPITVKSNVLVEEFIGNGSAAPRLINAPPQDPEAFLGQLLTEMRKLGQHGLTHGDLSAFNILNHGEKPVLIDLSQATVRDNARFKELFERDCRTVAEYFTKIGCTMTTERIMRRVGDAT